MSKTCELCKVRLSADCATAYPQVGKPHTADEWREKLCYAAIAKGRKGCALQRVGSLVGGDAA